MTIVLILISFTVFVQLSMLINAGVLFLAYALLRLCRLSKETIIDWYQTSTWKMLLITTIVLESMSLLVLLPITARWFAYLQLPNRGYVLIAFAILEAVPSLFKFQKLKEIL